MLTHSSVPLSGKASPPGVGAGLPRLGVPNAAAFVRRMRRSVVRSTSPTRLPSTTAAFS